MCKQLDTVTQLCVNARSVCWQVLFLIALAVHQEKESLTEADSDADVDSAFSFSRSAAVGKQCGY